MLCFDGGEIVVFGFVLIDLYMIIEWVDFVFVVVKVM